MIGDLVIITSNKWFFFVDDVQTKAAICSMQFETGWDMTMRGLILSFPKVINLKFPLQSHQKYYITQYGELGFS